MSVMEIKSSVFKNGGLIPACYTCDGENLSPPLEFSHIPLSTKSLVLVVDDPDAPMGTWDHWILFNLPPTTHELKENLRTLPKGTKVGRNSWKKNEYGGPCPPDKLHRYRFKLYALDIILQIEEGASKEIIEQAMKDHILQQATLIGLYDRPFHKSSSS